MVSDYEDDDLDKDSNLKVLYKTSGSDDDDVLEQNEKADCDGSSEHSIAFNVRTCESDEEVVQDDENHALQSGNTQDDAADAYEGSHDQVRLSHSHSNCDESNNKGREPPRVS